MKDVLTVGFSETAILGTQLGDRQPVFETDNRDFGNNQKKHARFSSLHVNEQVASANQAKTSSVATGLQLLPKMHIDLIEATNRRTECIDTSTHCTSYRTL